MKIQKKLKYTITSDEEISRSTKNWRKKPIIIFLHIIATSSSVHERSVIRFFSSINSEIRVKMLVVFSIFLKYQAIIWCFLDCLTGGRERRRWNRTTGWHVYLTYHLYAEHTRRFRVQLEHRRMILHLFVHSRVWVVLSFPVAFIQSLYEVVSTPPLVNGLWRNYRSPSQQTVETNNIFWGKSIAATGFNFNHYSISSFILYYRPLTR